MSAAPGSLARLVPGGFQRGTDPRRHMNGSRPRKLAELEKILDEHREPQKLRATLERLRELAYGEPITITERGPDGEIETHVELRAHPGFMKLYLDRVLGPVSEDNSEALRRIAISLLDEKLEAARAQREAREPHDPAE